MWLFLLLQSVLLGGPFRCGRNVRTAEVARKKNHGGRLNVARSYLGPLRDVANACRPVHVATHRASDQTLEAKKSHWTNFLRLQLLWLWKIHNRHKLRRYFPQCVILFLVRQGREDSLSMIERFDAISGE